MAGDAGKRKHGGEGDRGGAKKKQNHWSDNTRAQNIPFNSRGVLVSCAKGKELHSSKEAISILSEQYEELCPAAADMGGPSDGEGGGADISALLASEVEDLKNRDKHPFVYRNISIPSLIYVEIKYKDGPTPVQLVEGACRSAKETRQNKARLCNRFYPIEHVCKADMESMKKLAKEVAETHFPEGAEEGIEFSVAYSHRCSPSNLDRMDVINLFATAVKQPPHKVNLSAPAKSIMVNLTKDSCGVAVVSDFKQLGRFNLRELALAGRKEDRAAEKAAEVDKEEEEREKSGEEAAAPAEG